MDKSTIKILLVEDDEGDMMLAKRALTDCSRLVVCVVESVRSLSDAVKCLHEGKKYDVILLDMGLPDSSGIETVRKICRITDIPIVVLTGLGDEEIGLSAIKTGAADYLTKDMPLEKILVRTIRYVLERRRIEDELKAAHTRLIRTEKLATVGQLASTVAHELRNPLAVIKNAAYLLNLEETVLNAPEIKENVDIISEETDNANKIISDLLQFSRVKEPALRMGNVNLVIEKLLKKLKIPAEVELILQLCDNLPDIEMDSQQIEQVFFNLIMNAVQAMYDSGHLTIKTDMDDEQISISFIDNGVGISAENLKKVFEPLFSTKAKGTGLGLPVCALLVEKHGGHISVESLAGQGTTFIVRLPIVQVAGNSGHTSAEAVLTSAAAMIAKGE